MKSYFYFLSLYIFIFLTNCKSENAQKSETKLEKPLVDVKSMLTMSELDLEKVLGKIDRKEKVSGYPCERANCQRVFFGNEKYELLFKENKIDRITINNAPDLSADENAIIKLGFPETKPSFVNSGTVVRYNAVDGIHEISFNSDFILIIVNQPE